ncbi:MAG: hypothetical protein II304_10050 [Bacteroidales bacterium]|nr:hypothetical protein [Bacteroidales bacterium]
MESMIGKKYNNLLVLELSKENERTKKDGKTRLKCICDCGEITYTFKDSLISGRTKSCGCIKKKPYKYEKNQFVQTKHGKFEILERKRMLKGKKLASTKVYVCKCLDCGEINEIQETVLCSESGSCKACSESRSFGEKYFYCFLKQLGVSFETEYYPKWSSRKYYDFFFEVGSNKYIVEIDGEQHEKRYSKSKKTIEEIAEIDLKKDIEAKNNGHKLIRIKYSQTKNQSIEDNIKKSELANVFDMKNIDWQKCFFSAMSHWEREICELWNNGIVSTKEISKKVNISPNYISKILANCAKNNLCNYNADLEKEKGRCKLLKNHKKIICTDNGIVFDGAQDCSRKSEEIFGIYLTGGSITRVCRKERKTYKGFHFEYVE